MKESIIGLAHAVKRFNRWHGVARIYFDPTKNEVWTKLYIHSSEQHEYPNKKIVEVYSKTLLTQLNDVISSKELTKLCLFVLNTCNSENK